MKKYLCLMVFALLLGSCGAPKGEVSHQINELGLENPVVFFARASEGFRTLDTDCESYYLIQADQDVPGPYGYSYAGLVTEQGCEVEATARIDKVEVFETTVEPHPGSNDFWMVPESNKQVQISKLDSDCGPDLPEVITVVSYNDGFAVFEKPYEWDFECELVAHVVKSVEEVQDIPVTVLQTDDDSLDSLFNGVQGVGR